jgi:hypothetical protein
MYRTIHWYRFGMNLLYCGGYGGRFAKLAEELIKTDPKSVQEFCFGDTYLAGFCRDRKIAWQGIDLNRKFVKHATKKGFRAVEGDVLELAVYEKSDLGVIAGALYHFSPEELKLFLTKVFRSTQVLLISEPVQNLSSSWGALGRLLAGKLTETSKREPYFRYTRENLLERLTFLGKILDFEIAVSGTYKNDLILILTKK